MKVGSSNRVGHIVGEEEKPDELFQLPFHEISRRFNQYGLQFIIKQYKFRMHELTISALFVVPFLLLGRSSSICTSCRRLMLPYTL